MFSIVIVVRGLQVDLANLNSLVNFDAELELVNLQIHLLQTFLFLLIS